MTMRLRLETLQTDPISPFEFVSGNYNRSEKTFVNALKPLWETYEIYHEPVKLVLEEKGSRSTRCVPDFLVRVDLNESLLIEVSDGPASIKLRQSEIMQRIWEIDDWEFVPGIHLEKIVPVVICNIYKKDQRKIRSEFFNALIRGLGHK